MTNKLTDYYNVYGEEDRLAKSWGQIEFIRSQSIIQRYIKSTSATILDVGGAAGRYACWLAQDGHDVHLVDPVPLHVCQAQAASNAQPDFPLSSCTVGDARNLEFEAGIADAILLLGPLYHLVDIDDREKALSEAYRVLKSGGFVFAAGISRFASTIDGFSSGHFTDPVFQAIMKQDLEDGQHRNPTDNLEYFMDTFFHHPDELKAEVSSVGFEIKGLYAIEGISYMMQDLDKNWNNPEYREFLLETIAKVEEESSLIGASPHIMCVGEKS